jgi:hypothetical protein
MFTRALALLQIRKITAAVALLSVSISIAAAISVSVAVPTVRSFILVVVVSRRLRWFSRCSSGSAVEEGFDVKT